MKNSNVLLVLSFLSYSALGQDVSSTYQSVVERWRHNPVMVAGDLGFSTSYFNSTGNETVQSPFNYNVFGNINLDILGIQAPLGIFYSNKNTRYRLPAYHFVGISPSYKHHTLHLGDRNMSFGPYTFNGLGYTGIGLESSLGKFKVKGMYGRIRKATVQDATTHNVLDNSYRRMAWGAGVSYQNKGTLIDMHIFHASDDTSSIERPFSDTLKPISGTILGLKGEQKLGIITVRAEYAYNVLNKDIRLESLKGRHSLFGLFGKLQPYNTATGIYHAIKCEADMQLGKNVVTLGYERIDPGFQSPGTLFFNNDRETYSVGIQSSWWKNKLNINLRGGLQQNNLAHDRINTYHRWVTAANIGWRVTNKTNVNATFSNFLSDQKSYLATRPFIDVDTLILTQNNTNYSGSINHQLSESGRLSLFVNHNTAYALTDGVKNPQSKLKNWMANLGYIWGSNTEKTTWGASMNYSWLEYSSGTTVMLGPSVNISRKVWKDKWNISLNSSYFRSMMNEDASNIIRIFLNNEVKLSKSIRMDAQVMFLNSSRAASTASNEFMINTSIIYKMDSKPLIKTFKTKNKTRHEDNK